MPAPVVETNEEMDAVYALEKALTELRVARDAPNNWKWALISLHNALQGFMVLTLRFTNPALIARVPVPLRKGKWNDELLDAYNQQQLVKGLSNELRDEYLNYIEKKWRKSVTVDELRVIRQRTLDSPVSLLDYQLVGFSELWKRIQSPRYAKYTQLRSQLPFKATSEQKKT